MAITISRSTYQASQETTLQRIFFGEKDILLDSNMTPLLTMTTKVGNRRPSNTPKLEWAEDDFLSYWGQVSNTADYSSVATEIPVVDVTIFNVGDLGEIPPADSSSVAGEVVRVTAVAGTSTGTITLTRGIGGSGANTIPATGDIRILGPAIIEGGALPDARTTTKVVLASACQLFRTSVKVTGTQRATELYGARDDRKFQQDKRMKEHKRSIEQVGLLGRYAATLAAGATLYTSGGFKQRVTTNVTPVSTTLTEPAFLTAMQNSFINDGADEKFFIGAPIFQTALDYFAGNKLRLSPEDKVLGLPVRTVVSGHGLFRIVRSRLFTDGASGTGLADEAFILDAPSIEFSYLNGNGVNRDTQLILDVVKDGIDGVEDEWLTEGGWVIRHEKRHGRISGVTAFA